MSLHLFHFAPLTGDDASASNFPVQTMTSAAWKMCLFEAQSRVDGSACDGGNRTSNEAIVPSEPAHSV